MKNKVKGFFNTHKEEIKKAAFVGGVVAIGIIGYKYECNRLTKEYALDGLLEDEEYDALEAKQETETEHSEDEEA